MDILKLNKVLILSFLLFFYGCKEIHKKTKGYCNKYISGGMGFSLFLDKVSEFEFEQISITSKQIKNLKYIKKYVGEKNFIIGDSILLTDTLLITFKDKIYKLHSFKNGAIEIFTDGENGENYENCFLKEINFNKKIIKREQDLTFKIKLE